MTNEKWQIEVRSPDNELPFVIFHWSLVICHWWAKRGDIPSPLLLRSHAALPLCSTAAHPGSIFPPKACCVAVNQSQIPMLLLQDLQRILDHQLICIYHPAFRFIRHPADYVAHLRLCVVARGIEPG